jgi:hypothetical protein
VTVQVPAPVSVTVAPLTPELLHAPLTVKVTVKPEVDVAATVNGGLP